MTNSSERKDPAVPIKYEMAVERIEAAEGALENAKTCDSPQAKRTWVLAAIEHLQAAARLLETLNW